MLLTRPVRSQRAANLGVAVSIAIEFEDDDIEDFPERMQQTEKHHKRESDHDVVRKAAQAVRGMTQSVSQNVKEMNQDFKRLALQAQQTQRPPQSNNAPECYNCGKTGHLGGDCPRPPRQPNFQGRPKGYQGPPRPPRAANNFQAQPHYPEPQQQPSAGDYPQQQPYDASPNHVQLCRGAACSIQCLLSD